MQITVSDVSLKNNGNETASLSFKEKLNLAKNLVDLGVNVIEVGPVFKDKADEVLCRTLCGVVGKTALAVVVRSEKEIEQGFPLVAAAKNNRIIVELPVSPVRMEYSFGKKPQVVSEQIKTLTEKAAGYTADVETSLLDATRAERNFLYSCIKAAIGAGAKTVTLTDEAGLDYPQVFGGFIKDVYENVPELKNVKLCVSCSDALSFGAANNLTAIIGGAAGIKLSALNKAGLSSFESFAAAMESVLIKKGFSCTLSATGMTRILNRISAITAPTRSAEVQIETAESSAEIGEFSSAGALNKSLKKLGYDLSAEDQISVFNEYKRISAHKKVGVKEIEAIVASTAMQVPPVYTLDNFTVNSSNIVSAIASVVVKKDGEEIKGLSYGNGAIDAAFMALESIVGRHFELDDFEISALTEGKEAVGETLVKLRFNGKIYSGRGVSTDIVGASIRAYLSAVNKIVYEEENK